MNLKNGCWPKCARRNGDPHAAKEKKEPERINKWTLRIKDPVIRKEFEKYAMDNVMNKMPVLIGFQGVFLILAVMNLFTVDFVKVHTLSKAAGSSLILSAPYFLTKKTGKTIFMKWMPFVIILFQTIAVNYILFYALSEEG